MSIDMLLAATEQNLLRKDMRGSVRKLTKTASLSRQMNNLEII